MASAWLASTGAVEGLKTTAPLAIQAEAIVDR